MATTTTSATGRIAPVSAAALPVYAPTTYVDFSRPENRVAYEKALADVRATAGKEYPLVIGGERMKGAKTFYSTNPAKPSEVLGRFQPGERRLPISSTSVPIAAGGTAK